MKPLATVRRPVGRTRAAKHQIDGAPYIIQRRFECDC